MLWHNEAMDHEIPIQRQKEDTHFEVYKQNMGQFRPRVLAGQSRAYRDARSQVKCRLAVSETCKVSFAAFPFAAGSSDHVKSMKKCSSLQVSFPNEGNKTLWSFALLQPCVLLKFTAEHKSPVMTPASHQLSPRPLPQEEQSYKVPKARRSLVATEGNQWHTRVSRQQDTQGHSFSGARAYTLMLWLPLARSLPVRPPCSSSDA